MAYKSERWLDHTGLNLIRIVIGSYFMAISLGLIAGMDQSAVFAAVLPEHYARPAGSALLFGLSAAFMAGVGLRPVALLLAVFVLGASVIRNYPSHESLILSSFWRDLALACAVLHCYASLKRREMRHAALVMRRRAYRIRRGRDIVKPRRVSVRTKPATHRPDRQERPERQDCDSVLRPLIAPTGPIARPDTPRSAPPACAEAAGPDSRALRLPPPSAADDGEVDNIFANV